MEKNLESEERRIRQKRERKERRSETTAWKINDQILKEKEGFIESLFGLDSASESQSHLFTLLHLQWGRSILFITRERERNFEMEINSSATYKLKGKESFPLHLRLSLKPMSLSLRLLKCQRTLHFQISLIDTTKLDNEIEQSRNHKGN